MIKRLFLNDRFILLLITINSVILFLHEDPKVTQNYSLLTIADNLITALFLIELIIKLKAYGLKQYLSSGWNRLDMLLVILSLPAFATFLFKLQLPDISFLLVFRILRVFKAFRFFKFIPNVGMLLNGIRRALKTSVFVFTGFLIYLFTIGILSFYLFHNSGSEYFTTPSMALYSVFKIFTVEGWFEIPEQVIQNYSETQSFFTYVYFIFVVLSGGIFGLSLVNSIFVDSMVSDNNDELELKIDRLEKKIDQLINNNEK